MEEPVRRVGSELTYQVSQGKRYRTGATRDRISRNPTEQRAQRAGSEPRMLTSLPRLKGAVAVRVKLGCRFAAAATQF